MTLFRQYYKRIIIIVLSIICILAIKKIWFNTIFITDSKLDEKMFPEISNYNTVSPSDKLFITCTPTQINQLPCTLQVTVTNVSAETLHENNHSELMRLEKNRDGNWYYAPKEKQEINAEERIFTAGDSRTYNYQLSEDIPPGKYRILCLYQGTWGLVGFEVLV